MFDYKIFKKKLKEYRESMHLTQEQMSELLSCSPETIKNIELGHDKATTTTIVNFCNVLNRGTKEFMIDNELDKGIYVDKAMEKLNSLNNEQKEFLLSIHKIYCK